MRDYSLELAQVAAGIVVDVMGNTLKSHVYYSEDGNYIITEYKGYPLYNNRNKGSVFFMMPRSTFYVRKSNVYVTPIQQSQCRYYQESLGKPFAHSHVHQNGIPCWANSSKKRPVDIICNQAETLSLLNVTKDSVTIGRCASGIMGVQMEALANAQKQQKRVFDTLHCKPLIKDRRTLESYVSKRWSSKITMLLRAE